MKLTREEKNVIKAMLKYYIVKDFNLKSLEYEVSGILDKRDMRYEIQEYIDSELVKMLCK